MNHKCRSLLVSRHVIDLSRRRPEITSMPWSIVDVFSPTRFKIFFEVCNVLPIRNILALVLHGLGEMQFRKRAIKCIYISSCLHVGAYELKYRTTCAIFAFLERVLAKDD